jgi:hypothetical protein
VSRAMETKCGVSKGVLGPERGVLLKFQKS